MAGLVAPPNYPIPDPRKERMGRTGRIVNGPRFMKMGGLSGPGKLQPGEGMATDRPSTIRTARVANKKDG